MEKYFDKAIQYVIYISVHKTENSKYGVISYIIKMDKLCTHVIPKYANCGRSHQVITFKYLTKLKAQAEVLKIKAKKFKAKKNN